MKQGRNAFIRHVEQNTAICTYIKHNRIINTEEKAKVVAAVWETEFIQIPGGASYFAQGRVEE